MYLNKVIIIGNLTRDPELKALPSGGQVVNIGIATNRVWKDKEGSKQEEVEFHNVVFFGRTAEIVAQYLKKGSSVLVEGRLKTRSWEQEGVKKYMTEIIAESMQLGPRKEGGSGQGYQSEASPSASSESKAPQVDTIEYPEEEINPEDIPF
ncbi:single-stranded DNA-binding protein [Candidatus Campbellbacteria bacterium RIFOXYC2_FULL_35_25]|uniref:Single-stranded DNA-binding protein n=1 Tax=Candidatus Campbellbacteria bacterium RIFOXYC2_FULL_35_25 TaxID=1797582 RepID=A0A1F5EHU3_9BACT|nr:MAG: single-stranded DNA-binding protein [Candidatus Campbellbacteria bacterium RIFOXYC2_FULL_35_25]